ncbi:nitroreductase [Pseudonocardia sp. KRD-184]|uniref:Nitroreductase n=1 Tax=Pseudonocardia oceani TaxID=2792013 RepID=A0ABS6UHP5_9PSEU|nr:nitroreductase [Pseudonocardia oceani]MBW0092638.1 nitroreductase [Pseudonocardia oceani]MBW0098839.1 nitroreductase [Pseudonocardia oceani]MBW0111349.1 nitroreductase [Pseudonocardia oceani]MBW0122073.1 nitroreductase [Pseudonocardia oceani]MBW0131745.1 nitroreductase [Pseudonocardia oceani]
MTKATRTTAGLDLTAEQTELVLATAGRAPSLHNAQPWAFRVRPDLIELHTDPQRRLPVVDPADRELRMACGAALFTLRLALIDLGVRPLVTVLPDRRHPTLIAEIRRGGSILATPEQRRLLEAVPRRHTNRHPFTDVPVTPPERHALRRAASDEGAWLHLVTAPDERAILQRLAVRAHRQQVADPAFGDELRRWTGTSPGRPDGVPVAAGGPQPAPHDRWVLRDFTDGAAPERVPGKEFESDPLIAVLTSHLSGPHADVRAGEALQRVLLTATAEGLAVSFLSQLIEVDWARDELRRLVGAPLPPQAVLRVGRGWPVAATPRRPVADLLLDDGDDLPG